jgi:hypothetical protein
MFKKGHPLHPPRPRRAGTRPFPNRGRNEREAEEVHTALRVVRSPLAWVLANGENPPAFRCPKDSLLR